MTFPFEVPFEAVEADIEPYVDAVFSCLQSDFLTMPKGEGFIDYPVFEQGYEALKKTTQGFRKLSATDVLATVCEIPIAFVVLRTMLGFTPPEWAYVTTERTGVEVAQGAIRSLDRKIRQSPVTPLKIKPGAKTGNSLQALVTTACQLLHEGVPAGQPDHLIHRLNKADTQQGLSSLQPLAQLGVPYAMLLYERFLGRPFASHRDSVSDLVGDLLETAIENILTQHGVSYRKTKRAQRVIGFDQAPDFVIPNEFNPQVVIEAKITEDDGTARDKVARIRHLCELSLQGAQPGKPKFEVIACIAGRGFKVRREDMKTLLLETRGKVFTLQNLDQLVACSRLKDFQSQQP